MNNEYPSIHVDFTLEYYERRYAKNCITRSISDKSSIVFDLNPEYRKEVVQFNESLDSVIAEAKKISRRLEKTILTGRTLRIGVSIGYLTAFSFLSTGKFWALPFARDTDSQVLRAVLSSTSGSSRDITVFPDFKVWTQALKDYYTAQLTQAFEQGSTTPVSSPDQNLLVEIASRGKRAQ